MDDVPAAIQASFADFRLIKGRKQAQIILEIPIEGADAALAALGGIPQPQSDRWVAVARLNGEQKQESYGDQLRRVMAKQALETEPKEKRKWDDLDYCTQAGMRCNEPAFWKFLEERHPLNAAGNEEEAAEMVRAICHVDSRSELNSSPLAAKDWYTLDRSYQAWLKTAE